MQRTIDFITELFCRIDDKIGWIKKHSQCKLYASEIVTIGVLYGLKGVGVRAFYRWLKRDYGECFPMLPDRTRLFRLLKTHQEWGRYFLEEASLLGVVDTYGIELIHPMREGRSSAQIGQKGLSNHRWIVGGKFCFVLNKLGLICDWDCATANVHDSSFQSLIQGFEEKMIILADQGFHSRDGDPSNMKLCKRGTWNTRMMVETVLSMLTSVCHLKKLSHRVWSYFKSHLAWTSATFNLMAQWFPLRPDSSGFVHLSIAPFSL